MKKLNRGVAVLGTLVAALVIAPTVGRAATTMPAAVDGKITLTENVELSTTWVNTENVELDLAGYKITKAPERMYAINNKGTLKITDSSANKSGMIECTSENITGTITCVNNFENGSKLTIDGARVQAKVTAVKNNENATLNIINESEIISTGVEGRGIAVQNFGTATVKDSYIKGHNGERGFAINALSYAGYDSDITVEGSMISGKYAVAVGEESGTGNRIVDVKLNDVILDTENVYTASSALPNTSKEVTLGGDFALVLDGRTLVIDENVKLADDTLVILDENATIENKTNKDLVVAYAANADEIENLDDLDNLKFETITVKPNEKVTAKTEEVKEPEKDQTVSKDEEIKVPNTVDGVTTYIIIAIISLLGLGVTVTKLRRN